MCADAAKNDYDASHFSDEPLYNLVHRWCATVLYFLHARASRSPRVREEVSVLTSVTSKQHL